MKQPELISDIPDYIDLEVWSDYLQHRKEIRHKLTPTAKKYLLVKLSKFHENGIDVNLCIAQAIENGWQGVFEYEANRAKQNGTGKSESPVQRRDREAAEALSAVT